MTLDQIWEAFTTWEMGVCVIVWLLSGISFVWWEESEKPPNLDRSNCLIWATLNSIFVLLLLKL
jgi:hypothetical protein